MLHESGSGNQASTQSETMKAVILAGAIKDDLPSWSHSQTQPLDSTYGAGVLNVYNSYLIQSGGNYAGLLVEPPSAVGIDGWDYSAVSKNAPLYYNFEVPAGSTATELSIVLAWNAEVTDSLAGGSFSPDVTLDNLDLRLFDSSNSFLETEVEASISTVDNVEHIRLLDLGEGTYTLEVSNLTNGPGRDYGLAWRMETEFETETADFNTNGKVDGIDFLSWQQNFGTIAGAGLSQGDANGDADVDFDDFTIFEATFGSSAPAEAAALANPEPSTWVLLSLGMLMANLGRRTRKFPR